VLSSRCSFAAPSASATTLVPCPNPAPSGFPSLGGAAGFAAFALDASGTGQNVNFSNDTVNGDAAVASAAAVRNQAPSTIHGDVYLDSAGEFSGPGKVSGSLFANQDLADARNDALAASAQAAGLSANFSYADITSNTTINGLSGLNVISVNGNINVTNASLTLTGPADAFFVVNVAGSIALGGAGGIQVGGEVPTSQLIINMTGSGNLINKHVGNVVQGTLLGPNVGGLPGGALGSLLLGRNFGLMSGVHVTYEGCNSQPGPINT